MQVLPCQTSGTNVHTHTLQIGKELRNTVWGTLILILPSIKCSTKPNSTMRVFSLKVSNHCTVVEILKALTENRRGFASSLLPAGREAGLCCLRSAFILI